MKRIGIYFFCVIALGCLTSSILYRESEKKAEIRLENAGYEERDEGKAEMIETPVEDVMHVEEPKPKEETEGKIGFYLLEAEGYLVIYDAVSMEKYDDTTIRPEDLPLRLQDLVYQGLFFENEEELYAFLENYST